MRLVPMEGDRFHLSAEEAVEALRREHDRRRRDPRLDLRRLLRAGRGDLRRARRPPGATGLDVPVHVDGASGAFIAPFLDPDLEWDFRLPRVASINTSGHKYGLVYPGVGWIVWRDADALPEDLIFWVNYLGDNMPTFALNFSRPGRAGRRAVLQLPAAGLRRLPAGAAATRGTWPCGSRPQIAELGPVRAAHPRRRAARVRVHAEGRDRQLHRLRRVRRAARAGLAGAGVHVPGEPEGPRRAARRRQRGFTHDIADCWSTT